MRGGSARSWLVAVVLVALVARGAVLVATDDFKPIGDAADHDRIARSVAAGDGHPETTFAERGSPSAFRPPAYPYTLAATYGVAGESWTAGRIVGALLGTAAVALVALIALSLWGPVAGMAAGALAAVYPPLVLTSASLMSETLFIPVVLGLVLLLLRFPRPEGRGALALAAAVGALVGLAALTRSIGLLLLIPALVWVARMPLPPLRRVAAAGVVLAAVAVAMAPWTIRNQAEFGAFIPISTQDGFNLAGTYNADAAKPGPLRGAWRPPFILPQFQPLFVADLDEDQINRRLRSDALEYAGDHPGHSVVVLRSNGLRVFGLGPGHARLEELSYDEMGIPRRAQPPTRFSVYAMALLALAGAAVGLRRRKLPWLLWVVPALLLTTVLIGGGPRYRVPVDPFLVLFAAVAVAALVERLASRTAPASPAR